MTFPGCQERLYCSTLGLEMRRTGRQRVQRKEIHIVFEVYSPWIHPKSLEKKEVFSDCQERLYCSAIGMEVIRTSRQPVQRKEIHLVFEIPSWIQ
ncbi:hypothetical protein CEXT_459911 [Caerostris extrusa]|uniref:Uncharacterized protein n=1 Tax=Caerostris extrusa TaxID=172846 RepID=A0AAV4X449_CAEEX|nr:hypothetical protein CEXT_459911 [Caerostris extrusa]